MIDKHTLEEHGITQEEYQEIKNLIQREPNLTELGIFSLMWSEHCSYKSSKVHLKKFPTSGKNVIQGPGENAGVIDIGDGLAAVFKIESHNHPSFIEPYQGAATGVGGILRDIFTMGARPIATLDSLRFGPLSHPKNKSVMEGVVSGIAGYGNSIGVPTVGGETYFDPCYSLNPLVNVFCLGLAKKENIFYARAEGKGNPVLYVGSKTGRDGIHGATMASSEFGEDLEEKRPNVQVGDPFKEKLLLEACLEVMEKKLVLGIQDMGAAGLTCSTTEMAANSGTGIEIDLDLIPQREKGMTPYEIMLSESQERMLIVAKKEKIKQVQKVFERWDLDAVIIGKVTDTQNLKVFAKGQAVVDLPVSAVVHLCPAYQRETKPHSPTQTAVCSSDVPLPEEYESIFLQMVRSPGLANKKWIFRQYDHMIQTNTAVLPGADAAVIRIKDTQKALAISLDGNSLYTYVDPRTGGKIAVAEACRNLSCLGAQPLGVTNCLNFGNPEKPEIMWQFKEAVEGIAQACRAFQIPVTGGNVSFYNETEGASVDPTPVLGVVGLINNVDTLISPEFKEAGDCIVLLGETKEELGASEYLKQIHSKKCGPVPEIDLEIEKRVQKLCREAISQGILQSAHDLSEGGLAHCLAECCVLRKTPIGCQIQLDQQIRTDALLFGETCSRILVSLKNKDKDALFALAKKASVPFAIIGKTGGKNIFVRHFGETIWDIPVQKVYSLWNNSIPDTFHVK
ncbi:MAG: phosphoribosylformylglycinamidine synthase subunit PurL [Candidatus Aminicenantes bacterium]|nr:phosphoribosylformylglycinamidine synthase subunit PurL [Candidatus Aminicenantes bacterium]